MYTFRARRRPMPARQPQVTGVIPPPVPETRLPVPGMTAQAIPTQTPSGQPIPTGPPPKPTNPPPKGLPPKNMESKIGVVKPTDHREADKTEGEEFPEPEPPAPTEEMKQHARDGDETDEERKIIRDHRAWQGRKGDWENTEMSQGRMPKMSVARLNMLSNYGQDFANIDLQGRRMWTTMSGVPDGHGGVTPQGGGWIPMDDQTYRDVMKFRDERDSDRGQRFVKGMGVKEGQEYMAVARMRGLDATVNAGHLSRDPNTGYLYNPGGGDKNDPKTWDWYDQFGNKTDMPQGAAVNKGGMDPNHYELNTQTGATYPPPGMSVAGTLPTPTTPGMGASTFGGAWGGAYGQGTPSSTYTPTAPAQTTPTTVPQQGMPTITQASTPQPGLPGINKKKKPQVTMPGIGG